MKILAVLVLFQFLESSRGATEAPLCNGVVCPPGEECRGVSSGCENPPPGTACDPFFEYKCLPKCPPMCKMFCEGGFKIGPDGCEICECKPIKCNGAVCQPDEECKTVSKLCDKPRPGVTCKKCLKKCGPVCFIFCEFGNVIDKNGCKTCGCRPNPCAATSCRVGTTCEAIPNKSCTGVDCQPFIAACKPAQECSPVMCNMFCEFDFKNGADGCPICECNPNPCETVKCPANKECVPKRAKYCKNPPCPFIGVCERRCITCTMWCDFGFEYGADGCPMCKCKADPCQTVRCMAGHTCVAEQTKCKRAPCPFTAVCKYNCPLLKCGECLGGNIIDENGCRTCECKDPCMGQTCPPDE